MKFFCDVICKITADSATVDPYARILIMSMFNIFRSNEMAFFDFTSQTKFDCLDTVLNNKELSETTKKDFILKFCESQKIFWNLNRFFLHLSKN